MMNLVRWNPWRDMVPAPVRFNRLFDEAMVPTRESKSDSGLAHWHPVVDIYDKDDKIVIQAELPGVDKNDIAVDLKDNVLTLTGERSYEKEVKEENYHRKERAFGTFSRAFTLPEGFDPDKIEANYHEGLLKVEIPKPEKQKPKKITVH